MCDWVDLIMAYISISSLEKRCQVCMVFGEQECVVEDGEENI